VSKRAQQQETELNQILTQETGAEEELLESVEERIDDLTDEKYHYSLDIVHADKDSLRIGVYGVEGYELPNQRTIANAVTEQFGWTPRIEEGKSIDGYYNMRILDWDDY